MLRLFVVVIAAGLIVGALAGVVVSKRPARAGARDAEPSGAAPSPSAWRASPPNAPSPSRVA
jgi:hypothetical protein